MHEDGDERCEVEAPHHCRGRRVAHVSNPDCGSEAGNRDGPAGNDPKEAVSYLGHRLPALAVLPMARLIDRHRDDRLDNLVRLNLTVPLKRVGVRKRPRERILSGDDALFAARCWCFRDHVFSVFSSEDRLLTFVPRARRL